MRGLLFALALTACAAPARAGDRLDALRAFEGCWVGAFAASEGLRDERCFAPMQDGRQWRDTHAVVGAGYGGETIYAWDAELGRIDVSYFASDGALMRGHAVAARGGLDFPDGRYVGADGIVQRLRSRWRMSAADL